MVRLFGDPPPASVVEPQRALDRPSGGARVYIQDGVLIRQADRHRFQAYCSFELEKREDGAAWIETIEPGRLLARRRDEGAEADATSMDGTRLAAIGWTGSGNERTAPELYT